MNSTQTERRLIDFRGSLSSHVAKALYALVEEPVERLFSVSELNRLYADARPAGDPNLFAGTLAALSIRYHLEDRDREKIPQTGPVLVVANHPFGAADGVILGDILARTRSDIRLLGHQLSVVPELRPWIVPVNPLAGDDRARENIAGAKTAVRWLRDGGALGAFPAGAVSHLHLKERQVSDPPWQWQVAALARRTGATVVPVFFEGRNSNLFQIMGLLHNGLRSALVARELLRRADTTIGVRIGRPISPEKLARYDQDTTLVEYLRFKTYMLQQRDSPVRPRFIPRGQAAQAKAEPQAIVEPVSPALLQADIDALPASSLLIAQSDLQVFVAESRQLPHVLREIGRLREVTFRAVSEGSGKALDIDRFDASYLHLFMWNKKTSEIVGSYRFACVDAILAQDGVKGLYTSTLFKYQAGLLEQLGPALELGRSFIKAEYQRKATSLALLWRGIGEFLVRNPQYKVLFGPVSISKDYHALSREMMVDLLIEHRGSPPLAAMVKPRNPLRKRLAGRERQTVRGLVKDVEDLAGLVEEVEEIDGGGKGMPILLKHYLKLNAKLLGFNVDPEFGDCIDGLIVVDLRTTEPRLLKRFMGDKGYESFIHSA